MDSNWIAKLCFVVGLLFAGYLFFVLEDKYPADFKHYEMRSYYE